MGNYEQEKDKYEADLIDAQDRYFSARPQLSRTIHEEKIFEAVWLAILTNRRLIND